MRLELHPDAREELRAAALWYDERQPTLGDQLVKRVNSALTRIGGQPKAYPVWPGTTRARVPIRKARIEQFPYVIAFELLRNMFLSSRLLTPGVDRCIG